MPTFSSNSGCLPPRKPQQLPLPISLADAQTHILTPALAMLPAVTDTPQARVEMLAIALQESDFSYREQIGGPARGLWMFERGGGVKGVLKHHATRDFARHVCRERGVNPNRWAVYKALAHDDILACCFARLLLWTDPHALPALGDESGAWDLYLRTWRPGKPRPAHFSGNYRQALLAVRGE